MNTNQPDSDDQENITEYFEERAAIAEYDGGLPRHRAENQARQETLNRFGWLPEDDQ